LHFQTLPEIAGLLLNLPRLGNPYLSQSSYSILSDLFAQSDDEDNQKIGDQFPDVLRVILSSPPVKTDSAISPAWVKVLGDAMRAYNSIDAEACGKELDKIWKAVWNFLDSKDNATRKAAVHSLSALVHCFPPSLVATAVADPEGSSTIPKIISQVSKALGNVAYARSMPELLGVSSALITTLKNRGSRKQSTPAEGLLLSLIVQIGNLRMQKGFEYKEDVDSTLSTAVRVLGPEVLLRVLPLNLEPERR
jgi:ribosomal RNA-processing protein 12